MTETDRWQFPLPEELIAQDPAQRRGDSRLLQVAPDRGVLGEVVFRDLPTLLQPGDLLVLNDSRVLPARLITRRADSGGQVEILLVRPVENAGTTGTWLAMARPGRRLRAGVRLTVGGRDLEVVAKREDGQVVVRSDPDPTLLAAECGLMPLPPYIHRTEEDPHLDERRRRDQQRYQTVYNRADESGAGSVAAPTAGLHFSERTLAALDERGVEIGRVCLHVGPGTFKPPTAEQIARGRLHREVFSYAGATDAAIARTRARGGRVIAVGTTSLRVLETVARLGLATGDDPCRDFAAGPDDPDPVFTGTARRETDGWHVAGMTRLFLQPPDRVTAVDGLLTNFHLPGSSLLMLVAALTGETAWRAAYAHAVDTGMRFYSYGDCMLILPEPEATP